jgi:hypothetical protein
MQHAILAGIGIIAIHTAWGGLYLNFVKPGLRWWLLAPGAVVLAMGIYGTFTDDDGTAETGQETASTRALMMPITGRGSGGCCWSRLSCCL